jgi:hypothetical protein
MQARKEYFGRSAIRTGLSAVARQTIEKTPHRKEKAQREKGPSPTVAKGSAILFEAAATPKIESQVR